MNPVWDSHNVSGGGVFARQIVGEAKPARQILADADLPTALANLLPIGWRLAQ